MMSKEYLKMADVFDGVVKSRLIDDEAITEMVRGDSAGALYALEDDGYWLAAESDHLEYATHAINSHDELVAEVERLREFERDAMRYRWLMQNTKFGIGRNGKDWDLQVDGSAPDAISEISAWIDNRMGWRMR